jgi:hypothetical protein
MGGRLEKAQREMRVWMGWRARREGGGETEEKRGRGIH